MYSGCPSYVLQHLLEEAKKYNYDDVELYICEICWEPDWMLDLVEDPDEEVLTINDIRAINGVLIDAFELAHNRRFDFRTRQRLLDC